MTNKNKFISAVECVICKRIHRSDQESFFTIGGGLYLGIQGGLFGPKERSYFCCECLIRYLREVNKDTQYE